MRLELAMAGRLSLRAPGIPVAVAGIALSVAVMLLSIAIVSGFKIQIREKVTGFEHEVTVYPEAERSGMGIVLSEDMTEGIKEVFPEARISLQFIQPAIFKTDNDFEGIILKGLGKDGDDFIGSQIIEGEMPDWRGEFSSYPAVISSTTAQALRLNAGDDVMAHFFIGDQMYTRKLKVAAIYNTHFGEYDKSYAFAPIEMLQKLCRVDSLTGTAVSVDNAGNDPEFVAHSLRLNLCKQHDEDHIYNLPYRVETINSAGAMYFNWLELLDTNVVVILILMGCVAGFTLISCLFIIVLERVRMIGLLKALGSTDALIRRIFIYMACRIMAKGLIIGKAVALLILFAQKIWHFIPLDADAYYLSYVPVNITWQSVIELDLAVVVISFMLLLVPSHIISTLAPSETMRYE